MAKKWQFKKIKKVTQKETIKKKAAQNSDN